MEGNNKEIILISGYAKLPSNITSEVVYKTLVLVVLVDMDLGTVVGAECSLVTNLAKNFISNLLSGYNLNDGADTLLARFNASYFGQAKKAIETSIKSIFSKYREILAERQ